MVVTFIAAIVLFKKRFCSCVQRWISRIMRHIQMVILLEGNNKYKEGPFGEGEVAGEIGDWVDLGAFEQEFPENAV